MRTSKNSRLLGMILLPGICSALLAQSPSPAAPVPASSTTATAEKVPERLPGLDPRLIDANANPCDNFYQYACGNFAKLYTIPNDRADYWTGPMVQEYTAYVMHGMLERAADGGATRTANEQKIGDYYAACNDTAAIDRKGLAPLQPDFDRIAALKSVADLAPVLAHLTVDEEQCLLRHCVTKIPPLFNEALIFRTDEISYHGFPDPLRCPETESRKSLALYYYTIESGTEFKTRSTDYRPRPEDGLLKSGMIWMDKKAVDL